VDQVQDGTLAFELRQPREAFGDATRQARGRRPGSAPAIVPVVPGPERGIIGGIVGALTPERGREYPLWDTSGAQASGRRDVSGGSAFDRQELPSPLEIAAFQQGIWSDALTPSRRSGSPPPRAAAAGAGALCQRAREEERRSARTGANNMPSARTSDTRGVGEWMVAWQPSTAEDEVLAANLQIADWLEGDANRLILAGLDSTRAGEGDRARGDVARGGQVNGGAGGPAHSLSAREEERRESFPPPLSLPFEEPAVSLASDDRSSEEASRRASSTHVPAPSPLPAGVSTEATRGAAPGGRRQAGGGAQGQTGRGGVPGGGWEVEVEVGGLSYERLLELDASVQRIGLKTEQLGKLARIATRFSRMCV
jgi:hypothetical protein